MKVELVYGSNKKKEKLINIITYKDASTAFCALVDASILDKVNPKKRKKFLEEIQMYLNDCLAKFN